MRIKNFRCMGGEAFIATVVDIASILLNIIRITFLGHLDFDSHGLTKKNVQ